LKSRITLACLTAAAIATVTACGGSTQGQAKPAPDAVSASPSPSSTTHTASSLSDPGNPLKNTDPCTLLTRSEAQGLEATGGTKRQKIGSADTCLWNPKDSSLIVGIRTNVGLSGVQATGAITDITIGNHQAKKLMGAGGSCVVAIGVTSSSRVDVTLNGPSKTDPCPPALQVAQLVEPKLP
jgi:hypothetical protein